ncbi:peptide-N4-asparagine amidase [Vulcaniibacterium tengchongense]|uniref:Peptide N-acetyl-beta-D-glucosaminyl asparaginase amidase A n=1 Tax=Vulcaniibacterium tengchongense TaxID=1273429 RepID=A0A3N4VBC2_9GAMM|nr:peptide-N4-asparagine amidase [Vulcaniibacterium tengchongense]RPE79908.1 peptide N-acetyl-beta-D-glucosaminyl asparaginase amidase A [Vulcaniibacterium tengchongense]
MKSASRTQRFARAGTFALAAVILVCVHAATRGDVRVGAAASAAVAAAAPGAPPIPYRTHESAPAAAALPAPGGRDTALATPPVPRPASTPCTVELFRGVEMITAFLAFFGDDTRFPYAPPPACPGPWAKVVLKVALRNADPSSYLDGVALAQLSIGGVPLYAGGAQDNDVPTHWRAERDVTDYAAVLRAPGEGVLEIAGQPRYTLFNAPYYVSATLLFYPAGPDHPAPRVPDAAYSLAPELGWRAVRTPEGALAARLDLPRNIERAYLDVMAQARYDDLFWFTCLPDAQRAAFPELRSRLAIGTGRLGLEGDAPPQGCGGGSFRELQVHVDGQPAGVAPVFPRVHPQFNALWTAAPLLQPAPPPQALNFMPYRIDLTPFAGLLSDGAPHEVRLSVAGRESAAEYPDFQLAGTLLVYRDRGRAQVTGRVTRNTLAPRPPAPRVTSTLARDPAGVVSGGVHTRAARSYAIEGYVDTSRGRIRSTVERRARFDNLIAPRARGGAGGSETYDVGIDLESRIEGVSRRRLGATLLAEDREFVAYPLTLAYRPRGVWLRQAFVQRSERWRPGRTRHYTRLEHEADLGYVAGPAGAPAAVWRGTQRYLFRDSYASCYRVDLVAAGGALQDYRAGAGCPDGVNRLYWAAHPDGSPDGLDWAER